jgi:hypothetical protein
MNAVVQPIFTPDVSAMRLHVEHLFGGYLDGCHEGLIELSWTDTRPDQAGRYRLANAKLFGTDKLDELVDEASRLNATPMCNVYIGAALRHPDTAPFGRAQDRDAWALTCAYVDLDDAEAATNAKNIYGLDKPTLVVVTGRAPHTRAQLWWRLEEPLKDATHWPALLRGFAAKLHGDSTVTNPSRVMRLAGTIAWPVKPGRTVELTSIAPLREPGAQMYAVEHLSKAFPPIATKQALAPPPTPAKTGLLGMPAMKKGEFFRQVNDIALKDISSWVPAIFGSAAIPQQGTGAWRISSYALGRNLEEDLSIAPNGIVDFGVHDIGDARQGKRTPIDIIIEHGHAPNAKEAALYLCDLMGVPSSSLGWEDAPAPVKSIAEHIAAPQDVRDIYDTLDLASIAALPPPTWLIDGLVPESGLTFIYGKPGKGKSFFSLDMALRIAHGFDWHGKECKQGGVLYIAGEGKGGYRNRVHGWHLKHGLVPDCAPFRLLPRAVNFMVPEEVAKLVRTVKAVVGDAKLVVIDTVARVLPGAEENASKEMGLFVAACDAIRETCDVAVIGVHHSGKDEDRGMRGSSSLEGAGDCVLHLKRGDDSSIVEVATEKQKDGEEAKPVYLRLEKIEWMDGLKQASTLVPEATKDAPDQKHWPDKDTCRRILNAITEAWVSGKPWSFEPQSKRSGRYAPKIMGASFHINADLAETIIETWLMNDVLSVEVRNSDTKLKGLKVIGAI